MNSTVHIFKEKMVQSKLSHFTRDNIPEYDKKWDEIRKWYNASAEKYLDKTKETAVHGYFLTRLFNQVFGYTQLVDDGDCFFQDSETTTLLDTSESDGALGFFYKSTGVKDVRVVIELKDARTPLDKKQNRTHHLTPVEQAFSYANKNGSKCGWVIVSNFIETRLYKSSSSLEYESFDMTKMNDEREFLRFYFFICKDNLISEYGKSVIDEMYAEKEIEGIDISNKFYDDYKKIRNEVFSALKENNPDKDELLLFSKTQKLLDRFIFICFCEDCHLLPQNVYQKLIDNAKNSFMFSQTRLWDQLKGLFMAIDQGNPPMKINRYNGGLFKSDPDLDSLVVPDHVLESFVLLSSYDFNSDLNVNILGQIFEQSIADVEQIKKEISGIETERNKQKDDGIFYTPYYVTRYIVEQTVGVYLNNKKESLKKELFKDGPVIVEAKRPSTGRMNTKEYRSWVEIPLEKENMTEDERMEIRFAENLHKKYWLAYEEELKRIKICDPACGSGAFLNQCFDYLRDEMDFVLDMRFQFDGQRSIFDIDKSILQNNLYGVDLNPESVEITKLSLWLKTAKSNQTLASLDENIKCGNSIINDRNIVNNAFVWKSEFPNVFAEGGFDIVIGNPPYGARVEQEQKDYCAVHYVTVTGGFDTYRVFFELGFNILKADGYLGYITPNTFFDILSGERLREFLYENTLLKVVEVYNVFPNAIVEPVISIFKKHLGTDEELEIILVPRKTALTSTFISDGIHSIKTQTDLRKNEHLIFNYKINDSKETIVNDIRSRANKISDYCFVYNGAKPYEVDKGNPPQTKEIVDNKIYNGYIRSDETWIPYMRGKRISRFTSMWDGEYIKYGENLAAPRNPDIFFREKLFIRQTGDTIIAQIDNNNVANNTLHVIFPKRINEDDSIDNKYLLGILNSTLMTWFYQTTHPLEVGKPMAEVKKNFVEDLPVILGSNEQQTLLISIVEDLLSFCEERYDEKKKFLNYIDKVYEPKAISEKLESFEALSFKEFCGELKKQKIKLSSSEKMDLLSLFEEKVKTIGDISRSIESKQIELDALVYDIYGIDLDVRSFISSEISIEI